MICVYCKAELTSHYQIKRHQATKKCIEARRKLAEEKKEKAEEERQKADAKDGCKTIISQYEAKNALLQNQLDMSEWKIDSMKIQLTDQRKQINDQQKQIIELTKQAIKLLQKTAAIKSSEILPEKDGENK